MSHALKNTAGASAASTTLARQLASVLLTFTLGPLRQTVGWDERCGIGGLGQRCNAENPEALDKMTQMPLGSIGMKCVSTPIKLPAKTKT
jgi:hypothetical protein